MPDKNHWRRNRAWHSRRMYVDMVCMNPMEPGKQPSITLEKLQKTIPDFDWSKGHSGTLLPEDVVKEIGELWEEE